MTWPSLSPGDDPGPIFSASRHNAVNEVLAAHGLERQAGNSASGGKRQNTTLLIKNTTDTDVPLGGVLGFESLIFDADDNERSFYGNEPAFSGVKPTLEDHSDRIGIAVDLCPQGKVRRFVVSGWVQAKVNVTSTSHKFAKISDDDVTKLESAESGMPMLLAQSGTGVKWCIVQLGTSTSPTVFLGQATTAITSSTATFDVDNVVLVSGADPRNDPQNSAEEVEVKNTFSLDADDNALFWCFENAMGDYEAIRPGEGGDPPVIVRFRLTADLPLGNVSAAAEIINDDGTVPGTPTAITVTDSKAEYFGLGPYTSIDGAETGYEGKAIKYVAMGPVDRYYIIELEGPATGVLCTLGEGYGASKTEYAVSVNHYWGSNGSGRAPEAPTGGFKIRDAALMLTNVKSGDRWIATREQATGLYQATAEAKGLKSYTGYDEVEEKQLTIVNGEVQWKVPVPVGSARTVIVTSEVPSGDPQNTSMIYGEAIGRLLNVDGTDSTEDVTVKNPNPTKIAGASSTPIGLTCILQPDDKWLIASDKDFRGGPLFNEGVTQIWIHEDGDDTFKHIDYCKEDVVTEVLVNAGDTKLQFKKHAWDSCSIDTIDVADLEECPP